MLVRIKFRFRFVSLPNRLYEFIRCAIAMNETGRDASSNSIMSTKWNKIIKVFYGLLCAHFVVIQLSHIT